MGPSGEDPPPLSGFLPNTITMKRLFLFLALVFAVLAAGCTAPSPGTVQVTMNGTEHLPPDLLGTWTGTMNGYDKGIGFNNHTGGVMVLTVTGQQGRVFAGNLTITEGDATPISESFAGTIGRDGRMIVIVEEAGYCTGEIIGPDEIEVVYANDGDNYAVSIDSLRRV